jgi:hypothetical protein
MSIINPSIPANWKGLQSDVAQILSECGLNTEIEKPIRTARGEATIDVYAKDPDQVPPNIYLCECKYWNKNIPKDVILSFRTIVSDYGANWGLIISKKGFQRGAHEAANFTNLKLLNWEEFQSLFAETWYREYMIKVLNKEADHLIEYTEPINSKIFRKADTLAPKNLKRFVALRKKYSQLGFLPLFLSNFFFFMQKEVPELPLINEYPNLHSEIPDDIMLSSSLRGLLDSMIKHIRVAVEEFNDVFKADL